MVPFRSSYRGREPDNSDPCVGTMVIVSILGCWECRAVSKVVAAYLSFFPVVVGMVEGLH
jgi:hypothetical protein